jgi:methyl-accepting chemotaxis protein
MSTGEINNIVSQIQTEIQETKLKMDHSGVLIGKANEGVVETEKAFNIMSGAVKQAIADIGVLNQSVQKVDESKNSVVVSVEEISAISEESAAATEEVSASVEEQTSTIEDISSTADGLKDIAVKLSDMVKGFKI